LEGGVLFEIVAGGENHMQATAAYIESEQYLEIPVTEKEPRELQDVLSPYLPLLYRTAYRYLSNDADAEDAVQDALLSAYKKMDQFRGQAHISTWLAAIVSNCARMQLRKRPRQIHVSLSERFGHEQGDPVSERLVDCAPSPEQEYRKAELHERLMHFVETLSPPLRRAFQLRDLGDLTTSEAAQILGVSDGTLKAQLARARSKLTHLLRQALDAQSRASPTARPLQVAEGK
jgi:RNA polymerase sigma-70 factor (ECF subfamily)